MGIVDRHKKPGGFHKLVNSLETTAPEKQKKILDALRAEDSAFVDDVERCMFRFEEFNAINDLVVCEIIGALKTEMRVLAVALYKCADEALLAKFTKNMPPPQMFEFRDLTSGLTNVLARDQTAARFRIIEKARELEKMRKFTLKKYSEQYRDEI